MSADKQDAKRHWNIVVVVADTFRNGYIGAYGNDWVRTPNLDKFARQGVRFTRAHPECLPTIPTRRTLHSGRRAFPFNGYKPVPWDNVYLPGWQPMSPDETTVAETLAQNGYHTGFFGDVPHYFVPGMNFTRGFRQWEYVRGQAEDRYRAPAHADASLLSRYNGGEGRIRAHLVNVQPEQPEETWPTARTFRSAIRFIEQNAVNTPFYLYVDSFTPHETWEAPIHYYDLYGTREQREPICITVPYGRVKEGSVVERQLPSIRANYAGLCSLVDAWFGKLLDALDRLALADSTLVYFLSDHGTNFADNADRVTGKPASYMNRGTMDIPLIARHPEGCGAGETVDELVYTVDVPATTFDATGLTPGGEVHGQSLLPLMEGKSGFEAREYLTCRYGNFVWHRDAATWYFSGADFSNPRAFDLEADIGLERNIAEAAPDRVQLAQERILADAGGRIPIYSRRGGTDAIGRPQFVES